MPDSTAIQLGTYIDVGIPNSFSQRAFLEVSFTSSLNRMSLDSRQQAEAVLFGSVECCHNINTVTIGEVKPPDRTGGVLMLKLLPLLGLCLGIEIPPLPLAVDPAVRNPFEPPIVVVLFDYHRQTQINDSKGLVKCHSVTHFSDIIGKTPGQRVFD